MTTLANKKTEWQVNVIDPASKDLKAKFNVTAQGAAGVSETLNALHEYLSLLPDPSRLSALVSPGDYINLGISVGMLETVDGVLVPATIAKKDNSFERFQENAVRVIVVGVNPFLGKNGNGDTPHIALHLQNIHAGGNINPTETTAGGYQASQMRTYLKDYFLPALKSAGVPEARIYAPKRYIWSGAGDDTDNIIEDQVWLTTEWELCGGEETVYASNKENAENQVHLEYYHIKTNRRKAGLSGAGGSYWTASMPGRSQYPQFLLMNFDSAISDGGGNPTSKFGVVPAFCVY
jgi:hypothetical protein